MKKNDIQAEELSYLFRFCALTIYDSYKVSKWQMRKILKGLKQENENALAKRTVSNMVDEWATHNLCYMLHVKRANTKDVDLNYSLEWYWKAAYFIAGNIAKLIIE